MRFGALGQKFSAPTPTLTPTPTAGDCGLAYCNTAVLAVGRAKDLQALRVRPKDALPSAPKSHPHRLVHKLLAAIFPRPRLGGLVLEVAVSTQ